MERTLYEEWLNTVRLFSLEKWSQKGDAMELDKITNEQKNPTNSKTPNLPRELLFTIC